MNKNNKIVSIVIGIAIFAIGGSFYAGIKYNQVKNSTPTNRSGNAGFANLSPEERQARAEQFGNQGGMGGQRGARGAGGSGASVVMGEVILKDNNSVTIKSRDGGSKIIFLSNSTSVMKTIQGSTADLAVGVQITVAGNINSDGSVVAQSIQTRPSENLQ